MADLGSIILRRGTTAERLAFVPLKGEIIYDTELKQVYVGDGETYGGNNVFNETLVVDSDNNLRADIMDSLKKTNKIYTNADIHRFQGMVSKELESVS